MTEAINENQLLKKADSLRLSGDYDQAIAILEALCTENAFFAPAKLSLGRAYFESGKLELAITKLEEFVEFVPEHMLANKILARIYVHQKKFEQARLKVQIVLMESPEDPVALKLQEELTFDEPESLDQSDTVKTTMPTLTPTMAELYYHQGHLAEARRIYEQLLVHDPQNTELQEKLRMIDHKDESSQEEELAAVDVDVDSQDHLSAMPEDMMVSDLDEQPMSHVLFLERLLARVQQRKSQNV